MKTMGFEIFDRPRVIDIRRLFADVMPNGYTDAIPDVHTACVAVVEAMRDDAWYHYAGESPIVKIDGRIYIGDCDMEDFSCGTRAEFHQMEDGPDGLNHIEMLIGIWIAALAKKVGTTIASTIIQ